MQSTSLDNINPSNLKNFVRQICIVSSRYERKSSIAQKPKGFFKEIKKYPKEKKLSYKSLGTNTEKKLQSRVHQLEQELQKTREEKNRALNENRNKINELNGALMSVKARVEELLHDKQKREKRILSLEHKIKKKVE